MHQQTLVHGDHKLVLYRHDPEAGEIYNLREDPEQRRNLWHEAGPLRERLLAKMVEALMRNTGRLPERVGPA